MKYVYPAVFTEEKNGYSVNFPDFESCYTDADDLQAAIERAKDVLCLVLYHAEEKKESVPFPSDIKSIKTNPDEFATLIDCDTLEYRKFFDNKAVKKTLSVPAWLNDMAERENINFSQVLQEALKRQLNA